MTGATKRVDRLDWAGAAGELDDLGCAIAGTVLDPSQCREIADLYDDDSRFRSTIDMVRHRFGRGQYRYFDRPLPDLVADLRAALWPHLWPAPRPARSARVKPSSSRLATGRSRRLEAGPPRRCATG